MELYPAVERSLTVSGAQGADRVTPAIKTERLPFTVRVVHTEADLRKAVKVRQAAYARHVPDFARELTVPEGEDYADDGIVLLAESKLDGSVLGSTRIRTNLQRPLEMEASLTLPDWLQGKRMVEATRLGIEEGHGGRMVKMALIKACFLYCRQNDIEWSVATARAGVDRQYEQLLFVDVFPGQPAIALHHVGNLPHRVLAFDVDSFEERWTAARHPLLNFFFYTNHPDIDIGNGSSLSLPQPTPTRHIPEPARAHTYAFASL